MLPLEHVTPPSELAMQLGALISVLSCSAIVVSYARGGRWRRHPNPLLFWKATIDLVYALRFQYAWDELVNPMGCRALAALTQFSLIASECWFLSMSLDLYRCSTNPFTNVHQNLVYYHAFAWLLGALFAIALWCSGITFHVGAGPSCYVTEKDTTFQLLYYGVVVVAVLCAVGFTVLENQTTPHGGMKEALQAKNEVIRRARIFTLAYIAYQIVLITLWVADMVSYDLHSRHLREIRNASFFLQNSRGFIDLVIWISMNGSPCGVGQRLREDRDRGDRYSDVDIELQPQLNLALRKEVLHFTTRGVVAASANADKVPESTRIVRIRLHELDMVVRFIDYSPKAFREIRRGFGIEEEAYRRSFLATCHERIQSGGSSGAFMFYTADYMYLVKTITTGDRSVLVRLLPAYIKHLQVHPSSHLARYYGCHSIEMYGQVFSFIVMGNVIGRISMHQFYDIKGSWIDRNAQPIPPGKMVICTYCSNAFKYGENGYCEYSIQGTHQPHIILKDNDFHRKLRVQPETAEEIVEQLDNDTEFLKSQGLTDYSLLLSVHSTKYVVDHASLDVEELANIPTKRRIHYASCHADGRMTSNGDSGEVSIEVDGGDSSSEDGLDECLERRVEIDRYRNSGFLDRQFRYSILNHHDEADTPGITAATPLMSKAQSMPRYDSPRVQNDWQGTRAPEKPGYQASAVVGPDYYTIGVVDILQTWTWKKRLERLWKVYVLRYDPAGISAAPPAMYAARFQRKMREIMTLRPSDVGFGEQ